MVLSTRLPAFEFDNTLARLGTQFSTSVLPTPVRRPSWIKFNDNLAMELQFCKESSDDLLACLAGNAQFYRAEPVAQVYAGHQFGYFSPRLGDGRAILLGEVKGGSLGRHDIQLKGAGRTPFSRGGDGRAALGPVLREYLISEAMHALGIPTTRALAAVATGESVFRDRQLPGAVFARVASSHIRIGTFEYFAREGQFDAVKRLADYVIDRHYPECKRSENVYLSFFDSVMSAQVDLVAAWLKVGFVHGVMNTDNTSICGETIDYGPCAFINAYNLRTVYSAIDTQGRYSFGNQKPIILWNLTRFAECLLPLFDLDSTRAVALAEEALAEFQARFEKAWQSAMLEKLGLSDNGLGNIALLNSFLSLLEKNNVDYTRSFRLLSIGLANGNLEPFKGLFSATAHGGSGIANHDVHTDNTNINDNNTIMAWLARWQLSAAINRVETSRTLLSVNPAIIPRNHWVEAAISEALERYSDDVDKQDFPLFEELFEALQDPFNSKWDNSRFADPPIDGDRGYKTFCGT
jgi:uncharacterized protein YdiU (UPF0061 family)